MREIPDEINDIEIQETYAGLQFRCPRCSRSRFLASWLRRSCQCGAQLDIELEVSYSGK